MRIYKNNKRAKKVYFQQKIAYRFRFSGQPQPAVNYIYYGYIPNATVGGQVSVTQITKAMLDQAVAQNTVHKVSQIPTGEIQINNIPANSWVVAFILPTNSSSIYNGINAYQQYDSQNILQGSSANGTLVMLQTTQYKAYGEIQVVTGSRKIKII